MSTLARNFVQGKMNKELNERLIPAGEYVDATNVRISSSEGSEGGVIENAKGNLKLTTLSIDAQLVHLNTFAIGSYEDGANETIYWFVTSVFPSSHDSDRADFILSYNALTDITTYHVISMQSPDVFEETVLNFSAEHRINDINLVGDMLYFTDGFNPPRKINVKKSYAKPQFVNSYVDSVDASEYLVIKRPPIEAPIVTPIDNPADGTEDWFADKFVSFAYRYKYDDGEYSATSQFSAPVFRPSVSNISAATALNEGAVNSVEGARIDFNTGDNTVVGIDILYKEMDDNVIKVVEKIDKKRDAVSNDAINTYVFDGNKVYTILPESEILRSFDNVPLSARTQTLMSNRLIYGNYVEGYDMIDAEGRTVRIGYTPTVSSTEVANDSIELSLQDYETVNQDTLTAVSSVYYNFEGYELNKGSFLDFTFSIGGGDTTFAVDVDATQTLAWSYQLQKDYATVNDLIIDTDFQSRLGNLSSAKPVYSATVPTSCSGSTLFDSFACTIDVVNGSYRKLDTTGYVVAATGSGATGLFPDSTSVISLTFPGMLYVLDPAAPSNDVQMQVFDVTAATLNLSDRTGDGSLKSNRNYEVGMVYMDDFNRSTTALVSKHSNFSIDIDKSSLNNTLNIEIPKGQKPPSWASRYKFVIKQEEEDYNTIYSDFYYADSKSKYSYFLVEGENAAKINEGDILIIKADGNGPLNDVRKVTVLEKKAQEEDFITTFDADGNAVTPIAGVYMKIMADEFAATNNGSASHSVKFDDDSARWVTNENGRYPKAFVGPFLTGGVDIAIPAGSRIAFQARFRRAGGSGACEQRDYTLTLDLASPASYPTFRDWWNGEQIYNLLDSGTQTVGGSNDEVSNVMINTETTLTYEQSVNISEEVEGGILGNESTNKWAWTKSLYGDEDYLVLIGTKACGVQQSKQSFVSGYCRISNPNGHIVFETEGDTANPDIWYENEQSFPITGGFHAGSTQDQTVTDSALIATSFQNCYAFGNGIESYRIKDSIVGNKMKLGNRVTSTQAQDYKSAHRFADLTYSGVINDESNINRLNEFNGGLLNFKSLEDSFGPIQMIDARKTDILVLQEDKISTVLAGKNLLSMSDSAKGGALLSVPDVLGQQLSRQEDFGISNNPESYASHSGVKYFTDVKRGAVLQMAGDTLTNVANAGMASYFREQFIEDSTTYKLGGYDPYMKEYILSNSASSGVGASVSVDCGQTMSISLDEGEVFTMTVNYDDIIGVVDNAIVVSPGDLLDVIYTYNGASLDDTNLLGITSLTTIDKNVRGLNTITYTMTAATAQTVEWTTGCVTAPTLNVIQMIVSDNGGAGKVTLAEYYVDNEVGYVSNSISQYATLASDLSNDTLVSQYTAYQGIQGSGAIPNADDTVYMSIKDNGVSDFAFDASAENKMFALKTSAQYTDSSVDALAALAAATEITNIVEQPATLNGDVVWEGSFTLSNTPSDTYLYLIYDLRTYNAEWISFGNTASLACCNQVCSTNGNYLVFNGTTSTQAINYVQAGGASATTIILAGASTTLISETEPSPSVVSDKISITLTSCN